MDYDVDDMEGLQLTALVVDGVEVGTAGVSESGVVYLPGDTHCLGSATALIKAAKDHIPYVALSAVKVLFPAEWLVAEHLHDLDRLRMIDGMVKVVRSTQWR